MVALLRMELHAKNVAASHGTGKIAAVTDRREHILRAIALEIERMKKVETRVPL
jgi:hypothetical protein